MRVNISPPFAIRFRAFTMDAVLGRVPVLLKQIFVIIGRKKNTKNAIFITYL